MWNLIVLAVGLLVGLPAVCSAQWRVIERTDDFGEPRDPEILGPVVLDETGFGIQSRVQADCDSHISLPGGDTLELGFNFSESLDRDLFAAAPSSGWTLTMRAAVDGDRQRFLMWIVRPDSGVGGDLIRFAGEGFAVDLGIEPLRLEDFEPGSGRDSLFARWNRTQRYARRVGVWQRAAFASDEIVVVFGRPGRPVRWRFDMRGSTAAAAHLPCFGVSAAGSR